MPNFFESRSIRIMVAIYHSLDHFLHAGIEIPNCPICLEAFAINANDLPLTPPTVRNPVIRIEGCGHFFHYGCLVQWLRGKDRGTCPSCRVELFRSPTEQERRIIQWLEGIFQDIAIGFTNVTPEYFEYLVGLMKPWHSEALGALTKRSGQLERLRRGQCRRTIPNPNTIECHTNTLVARLPIRNRPSSPEDSS